MGTLAKEASNQNKTVSIYSSDQDLLQLVDEKNYCLFRLKKDCVKLNAIHLLLCF
ncbi:hypothetical protein ACEW7V_00610 [Areca yellow leaf disease phytoplasma]|uniref:hypothetical protein n=1 Tax=Areca yellow leaf disease phytoplasma TaxID=927614 RepID=UPI0035B56B44